jgi:hypothetical protein
MGRERDSAAGSAATSPQFHRRAFIHRGAHLGEGHHTLGVETKAAVLVEPFIVDELQSVVHIDVKELALGHHLEPVRRAWSERNGTGLHQTRWPLRKADEHGNLAPVKV